jgi:hypothetical protein
VPVNDGEENPIPPVSTMDVTWPESGDEAVAVPVEDEEGVVADGLKVTVVGGLLLSPVNRALGAVDIQDQTPRERAGCLVLHQVRIEAREAR